MLLGLRNFRWVTINESVEWSIVVRQRIKGKNKTNNIYYEIWSHQIKSFIFPFYIKLLLLTKDNCIVIIYFDFSKAFDLVSCDIRI